jgi:hypothetical protein
MDPDAYQLSHSDGGGQYDNSKSIREYIHTHVQLHSHIPCLVHRGYQRCHLQWISILGQHVRT